MRSAQGAGQIAFFKSSLGLHFVLPFSTQDETIERQEKRRSGKQYPPTIIGHHLAKIRSEPWG